MKPPFVSRRKYDAHVAKLMAYVQALTTENDQLRTANLILSDMERDQRWRRMKLEGLVQFKDERIRRVLGLPIWPAEEKKAG
jgi:hypothetical protein